MTVYRFDVLESTNLHLVKMAQEGAPAWTVVLADAQSGGMGRSGRSWWSPRGGLYMSVLIRPPVRTGHLPRLPVLASLAVLDAIGAPPLPIGVKWPNDLMSGGKKLAGILVKSRTEGTIVPWVVAGFGINLARSDDPVPEEIKGKIAFLEDVPVDMTRDQLAGDIVRALKGLVGCLEDDKAWEQAICRWTQSASWDVPFVHRDGTREIRGMPVRLAEDGGLVLRTDRGEVTVHSGEIIESGKSPSSNVQRSTEKQVES